MSQFNIEISETSNQNIVKFVVNSFLTRAISYEFKNIDDAKPSPLAQQLFYLPFVKTVYISQILPTCSFPPFGGKGAFTHLWQPHCLLGREAFPSAWFQCRF